MPWQRRNFRSGPELVEEVDPNLRIPDGQQMDRAVVGYYYWFSRYPRTISSKQIGYSQHCNFLPLCFLCTHVLAYRTHGFCECRTTHRALERCTDSRTRKYIADTPDTFHQFFGTRMCCLCSVYTRPLSVSSCLCFEATVTGPQPHSIPPTTDNSTGPIPCTAALVLPPSM